MTTISPADPLPPVSAHQHALGFLRELLPNPDALFWRRYNEHGNASMLSVSCVAAVVLLGRAAFELTWPHGMPIPVAGADTTKWPASPYNTRFGRRPCTTRQEVDQ